MRYLSVCSGIEAATVAWHPLGFQPVAFAEVDAFPSGVLADRWPAVPNVGDINNFQECGQVAAAFNIHGQNSCAMRGAGPSLAALETRVSRCLDTAGFTEHQGGTVALGPTGTAVRRITPRECERLQGFPDDYTLITYRGKPAADGPRYKALGNSMCVNVMRWIGERLKHSRKD